MVLYDKESIKKPRITKGIQCPLNPKYNSEIDFLGKQNRLYFGLFNSIKSTAMSTTQKEKDLRNYRNFGLALLGIIGILVLILIIGSAYKWGYYLGSSIGMLLVFYIKSGLFFGTIFALIASLEKKNPFKWVLVHGLLGWGYVIYYALTRKRIITV